MLVKVQGPPEAVAERIARGLAARGYDEQMVRDALVHDTDGVSLPAAGERLDVLLAFLDGMDARYTAWPLLVDGNPGRAAAEKKPSLAPLWGVVSLVCFGLALVVLLLPKPGEGVRRGLPDLGVAVAAVDAAPPAPDADSLQIIGATGKIDRATMERARAVSVRIETGDGRMGAGVVVSEEGDVLTTSELLRNDRRATVRFADGRVEQAVRAPVPPRDGFGLLKLDSKTPTVAADLGSGTLRTAGEPVFVVGSLGADFAIRTGRITRPLLWLNFRPYLTCDAGLGPFHEGAPLFDEKGRVVGITTGGVHRRERLVAFIDSALEGDTVMADAGLGRNLSREFAAVMSASSVGEVDPTAPTTRRPELLAQARRVPPRTRRRGCPRFSARGSALCRSNLRLTLVQVLAIGGKPLPSGDVWLRFVAVGDKDAKHVRAHLKAWSALDRTRTPMLLLQKRLNRRLPKEEGRALQATVDVSGLELYRYLKRTPKTGDRFVAVVDGVESNVMTAKLR